MPRGRPDRRRAEVILDEATESFQAVGDALDHAGLLAGDAKVYLRDIWHLFRELDRENARLAEIALLRECPECGLDLEEHVDGRLRDQPAT